VVAGDGLRGLGAIEGNIDKLIADRMKKRGMSWTRRGVNRMARLISVREQGDLNTRAKAKYQHDQQHIRSREKTMLKGVQRQGSDNGVWLSAGLPALHDPHSNHPWAHGAMGTSSWQYKGLVNISYPGFSPTNS